MTTRITASPALGPMAQMANAQSMAVRAYLKGARLRIDLGPASSIIDVARQQVTMLDHTGKLFRTTSFAAARPEPRDSLIQRVSVTVQTFASQQTRTINGLAARRTTVIARVPARNPSAARAADQVVITDIWATNANGIGRSFDRVASAADEFGAGAPELFGMVTQNPRAAAAFEKSMPAVRAVKGLPVRKVVTYGNVKVGTKLGAGMQVDTVMSVTTEISGVKNASLPASLFEVPRGYAVSQ